MLKKCVERYCELANKKVEQLQKVSSPCLDGHQCMQEELESVEAWSEVCSQIPLKKVCIWHELDNLTFYGRSTSLQAVLKWTHASDRRLARLISYIHHTHDFRQHCHVGNKAQHCRLSFFQDSDFAVDRYTVVAINPSQASASRETTRPRPWAESVASNRIASFMKRRALPPRPV